MESSRIFRISRQRLEIATIWGGKWRWRLTGGSEIGVGTEGWPTPLRLGLLEVPQVADVQQVEHAVAVDDLPARLAVCGEDGGQVFQAVDFLVVHHDRWRVRGTRFPIRVRAVVDGGGIDRRVTGLDRNLRSTGRVTRIVVIGREV